MHRSALSVILLKKLYFKSVMHKSAQRFFKKNAEDSGTEDTDLYVTGYTERFKVSYSKWIYDEMSTHMGYIYKNKFNSKYESHPDAITFTKFLLDVGGNNINLERILNTNTISIPDNLLIPSNMPNTPDTLITQIFPNIFFGEIENNSAILTPKNCDCDTINSIAIRRFCEETPIITLYSADTVTNEDGSDNINDNLYPIEFLNSLNVQGFPLHKLELKN